MKLTPQIHSQIVTSNKRAATVRRQGSTLYHVAVANGRPRILCGIAMQGPLYADFHGGPARLCKKCWRTLQTIARPRTAALL